MPARNYEKGLGEWARKGRRWKKLAKIIALSVIWNRVADRRRKAVKRARDEERVAGK
jgi:hypothetical protein